MGGYSERLLKWISHEPDMMHLLHIVQDLNLPQGCISAGFVRNYVWDTLHGYDKRTALNDVDVIYFDPEHIGEQQDMTIERHLKEIEPHIDWQVRNQARMHLRNGHSHYMSVEDAMRYWPETATAVGIRIRDKDNLELFAPHGLNDLFELVLRQSPYCDISELFYKRIEEKMWLIKWPQLKVIEGGS